MSKTYFELNGKKYYGYDFLGLYTYKDDQYKCDAVVDNSVFQKFKTMESLLDKTVFPPKNSPIYVAPGCPIPTNDIRHNYIIKRKPDTGDYNVFSPGINYMTWDEAYRIIVVTSRDTIICNCSHKDKTCSSEQIILKFFPDFNFDEEVYFDFNLNKAERIFYIYNLHQSVIDLIEGKLTKPCVSYKNLKINDENQVTQDLLKLVYSTGIADNTSDGVKNFQIQLHALNQHNWRNCRRTIWLVFSLMLRFSHRNCCKMVWHYSDLRDKAIKQLYELEEPVNYSCKEDFELARQFVGDLLGINEKTFFTTYDCIKKRSEAIGITSEEFQQLFGLVVRVKANEWVDGEDSNKTD